MDLRLLCTATFLGVLGFCSAQQKGSDCIMANAQSCGECIQISEKCGWCTDVTFLKRGESNSVRCDEMESLVKRGCKDSMIENPRGETRILKNNPVTTLADGAQRLPPEQITQIQPQKLALNLRSGEPQTFSLKFKLADSLSSEVILENSKLPRGVSITYKSICKNGVVRTGQNGRKCSKISIGDEVSFEISIEFRKCPNRDMQKTIKIKPLGSTEEVEIVLNFICECDCHKFGQPKSELCHNGNGTFECGACRCNEGRIGQQCECSTEEVSAYDMDANCRRDYGTDICSNNGDCVCGTCECKKRENPEERYSGKFCECDNFNCDRSNNKLCGGQGRCECRVCVCDANYTGSACDCSLDTSTCLAANKQICNGRGTCECGVCKCTDAKFQGPTCEICPTCPGVCAQTKECVQCLAFGTGEKKNTCEWECRDINLIRVKDRHNLPEPGYQSYPLSYCKEREANDCWFYYSYAVREFEKEVHVVETLDCPASAEWSIMDAIQALFRGLCSKTPQ